ncbi:MAG: CoA transferase, partial [Chloroflexi bacterium]|nr:CoA transferase [Chloroflexota bacterium]
CIALGLERILDDPSFRSEDRDITLMRRIGSAEMAEGFARKPAAAWLDALTAADIPCGPILTRAQVFDEPQILANDAIVDMLHPDAGPIKIAGVPVALSDNPSEIRLPAPSLGQHTDEVLRELGYSGERIRELQTRRVVT